MQIGIEFKNDLHKCITTQVPSRIRNSFKFHEKLDGCVIFGVFAVRRLIGLFNGIHVAGEVSIGGGAYSNEELETARGFK